MLDVFDLTVRYGKHVALDAVSLTVGPAEMVAILGANGAGKSSLLSAIVGRVPPSAGQIRFDGKDITHTPTHQLAERGIACVPEGRGIFPGLTVSENLRLGANPVHARPQEKSTREQVFSLFPKLAERRDQIAGTMSGGEQQMVAIGRAMMSSPRMLLLDEPSLGLAPIVAREVFAALARIRESGLTIIIVEQNAHATLALADRAYLIETGRITGSGRAADLRNDPSVERAFLGGATAKPYERTD